MRAPATGARAQAGTAAAAAGAGTAGEAAGVRRGGRATGGGRRGVADSTLQIIPRARITSVVSHCATRR
jgi:hypothetical protein